MYFGFGIESTLIFKHNIKILNHYFFIHNTKLEEFLERDNIIFVNRLKYLILSRFFII